MSRVQLKTAYPSDIFQTATHMQVIEGEIKTWNVIGKSAPELECSVII